MQAFEPGYLASSNPITALEEMAQSGVYALFRTRPTAMAHNILDQLDRPDRVILLLLDGKRTVADVARLTHRRELEVAQILVRLLRRGYIEFLGSAKL